MSKKNNKGETKKERKTWLGFYQRKTKTKREKECADMKKESQRHGWK